MLLAFQLASKYKTLVSVIRTVIFAVFFLAHPLKRHDHLTMARHWKHIDWLRRNALKRPAGIFLFG
jgi:uncharacterized protein YacL